MSAADNWIDALLPFPRPEYAKQTESLLTDLIWRSPGSSLSTSVNGKPFIEHLSRLKTRQDPASWPQPDRLVPRQHKGGNKRVKETLPLALALPTANRVVVPQGAQSPTEPLLHSLFAPQARGDKSIACVPLHPSIVALQTLHGLVNKESPSNLALAIETMGWLGGAQREGEVAALYLSAARAGAAPRQGVTGATEYLLPEIARHVWTSLPSQYGKVFPDWPNWPEVVASQRANRQSSVFAAYSRTPFAWFWEKWRSLCGSSSQWSSVLPARRFVDWALCLLRTGLAFSYLWEAEFYCRLHERVAIRAGNAPGSSANRLRSLIADGTALASIEPPSVPATQKNMWPATAELIARGWKARSLIFDELTSDEQMPAGTTLIDSLDNWVNGLNSAQLGAIGVQLQTTPRMANNQKEFVKYLLLPRLSDDDSVDQADFYFLARTSANSRQAWFRPGPEWLVVVTSLLCRAPGGQCTLGELTSDLAHLGIRAERSVIVGLLEEAGLSTDSPDADNALVIRAGF
jgi:hypothetical protein